MQSFLDKYITRVKGDIKTLGGGYQQHDGVHHYTIGARARIAAAQITVCTA